MALQEEMDFDMGNIDKDTCLSDIEQDRRAEASLQDTSFTYALRNLVTSW